jgi:hypothetical protein
MAEKVGFVLGIDGSKEHAILERWECPDCKDEIWVKANDLKHVCKCVFCGWSVD